MNTKKMLNKIGIAPLREINFQEKNNLIKEFAELMLHSVHNLNVSYEQICKKMFQCKMYIAKFDIKLGNANYVYKNNAIYFRNDIQISCNDYYILHELIHYFQDIRDENGNLKKIGICDFKEFKVRGLALNEAAVQHIVAKMLQMPEERINFYGINLQTNTKGYYPLTCDLINKIIYFFGEDSLINSVLFSTDKFKLEIIDCCGEDAFKDIQSCFDAIDELQQKLRYKV